MTRQSVVLRDAAGNGLTPIITYDPVARVVTVANPDSSKASWLEPGQFYSLEVLLPQGPDDPNGLRAIDGATLNPSDPNRRLGFAVVPATGTTSPPPTADFCRDVLPVMRNKCSAPICHGSPVPGFDPDRFGANGRSKPAAGLILDNTTGFQFTAMSRVANGSNTGPLAGRGAPARREFGIDMPIVDPGNPGNSWLLYKVLLAEPPATAGPTAQQEKCDGTLGTPPIAPFDPSPGVPKSNLDALERAALSDYVLGREMPYPAFNASGKANTDDNLSFSELERLRLWISQGAPLRECGACEP